MSKRQDYRINHRVSSLGRRRLARRAAALVEALEKRRLLSQPYVFNSTGIGGTGTEYWANVNPNNSNEIYMETDMGEVWHTTNDGLNWQTLNMQEQLSQTSIYSSVQFTNNPNIQYALNGTAGRNNSNLPMKTTNDGQTWSVLSGWTPPVYGANKGVSGALWADPNNSTDLIVSQTIPGGGYAYFFSSTGGNSFVTYSGKPSFASSASGSEQNWTAGAFFDPNGNNFYFATDYGLWITTNAGGTWTQSTATGISSTQGFYSFTGSDQGGTTRLWGITWDLSALTGNPNILGTAYYSDYGGLYMMTNPTGSGASWANEDGTIFAQTSGAPLYPRTVQTIDGDVNDVWIGGGDTVKGSPIVYAGNTTNSGGSWSWTNLLYSGADTTNFPGQTPDENLYTKAFGDNGDGGQNQGSFGWGYFGDTVTFTVDRKNPDIMTFTGAGTEFETINGTTATYTSQGFTSPNWYDITNGGPQSPSATLSNGFIYETPTPSNPDPYYSNNSANGYEWNPEGAVIPPYVPWPTSSQNETSIWAMSFPAPNVEFADCTDVTSEFSSDGGQDWLFNPVDNNTAKPNTFYDSVYDPNNGIMYAVTSGDHNLYLQHSDNGDDDEGGYNFIMTSNDDGQVWTLEGGLLGSPSWPTPPRTIAYDPDNANIIYAGIVNENFGGIWETTNALAGPNATWFRLGDGTGAAATATISGGAVTGLTLTNGGSGYAPSSTIQVYFYFGNSASATATTNASGVVTGLTLLNGGSGYTTAPTVYITSSTDQPEKVNGNYTAMHANQLMVLPEDGNNLEMVSVAALDTSTGYTNTAGVFTCTSSNGGQSWSTWTSTTQNPADVSAPGSSADLSANTYSLTIDPNNVNDWYITTNGAGTAAAGYIYESTNSGGTWSVYSTVGQGYSFWIQPGGTEALFGTKGLAGLEYTPNYTASNPQFYYVQGYPFQIATNIYQNPFDPNQIWVTSFGNGMWEAELGQIATASVPQNVTATAMNSSEAMVTWTPDEPLPSSYNIQYSTTGIGSWSTPVNVPTNAPLLGVGGYEITSGGSGYSGTLTVTFSGGGGTGATANASQTSGAVSSLNILTPGSGYTSAPTITITDGSGSGAAVTATLSPDPQSYLVTGLSAGTLYYFQISSVDSGGTSAPSTTVADARTDSAPNLFAYDEFTQATGNLNGTGSGTGWTGNWTSGTTATVVSSSWDPTGGPLSSGNSVQINGSTGGAAYRTLSGTTVGSPGTVLWASFDEYTTGGGTLLFGNSTNGFGFGTPQYGTYAGFYTITNGTTTYHNQSPSAFNASTSHFFVAKIDFEANATSVTLYVDPTPGLTYPSVSSEISWAAGSGPTSLSIPTLAAASSGWTPVPTSTVTLTAPGSGTVKYDEVRLGDTYTDVTPPVTAFGSPTAPSGITANDASTSSSSAYYAVNYVPNTVDLSWTNNATDQEGEYIQQSGGGSGWTTIAKIYDPSPSAVVTSYVVTDLSAGTAYKFQVASYNNTGTSSYNTTASSTTTNPDAPAAATDLTATATGSQVTLTWSKNTNASGYYLQYVSSTARGDNQAGGDGNNNQLLWNTQNITSNSTTSYAINVGTSSGQIVPDTLYYFRIFPYNAGGSAPVSNLISDTSFPAPTITSAVGSAPSQVVVSWTANSENQDVLPTDYQVDYSSNGGSTWTDAGTTASGATDIFTLTGLSNDTQYLFRVQAQGSSSNSTSDSSWSTSFAGRTLSDTGLDAYEGFDYAPTSLMNGQSGGLGWTGSWAVNNNATVSASSLDVTPTASYAGSTNASNYLLTSGNSFDSIAGGNITRTLSSALPNSAGTTVWASVMVDDQSTVGNGYVELLNGTAGVAFGFFTTNKFTLQELGTQTIGTPVGPPVENDTYLLVMSIAYGSTNDTVSLWVDPDPTASGPGTATVTGTTGSTHLLPAINSAEIIGSISGSQYGNTWDELRIGTSYNSVAPMNVPNAPTSLTAGPSGTNIALAWTASTGANVQGYDVWRSTNGTNFGTAPYVALASTASSYTDTTVSSGTTYYYEVTSENTTGDSLNSNVASLAAGGTKPAAPSNLAATPGTNSVVLTWQDNATNATSLTIQRSTDDATWSTAWTGISSTATTFTDTTPSSGVTYYYQIEAVNGAGDSAFDGLPSNCGVATVYAYEGFNYATATTWNGAPATGVGFTGNWTVVSSSHASIISGLNYTSGSSALTTSGNAIQVTTTDKVTGTLASAISASNGTTLWVGFEFSGYQTVTTSQYISAELDLGTSTNELRMGATWQGTVGSADAIVNGTSHYMSAPTAVTANTTYFVVYEIQYASTGDIIKMFADPTLGPTAPATATNTLTLPSSAPLPSASTLTVTAPQSNSVATLDEIRLGASFGSVAPDPIISSDNSGSSSKRHSSRGNRATPFLSTMPTHKHTASPNTITQSAKTSTPPFYPGLDGGSWHWVDNDADNTLFGAASNDANGSWQGVFN